MEPEAAPVDLSNDHDDSAADEDSEARGSDMRELRSGAPKFPTRSSLAIVGILSLNEEMDSGPLRSFLKNTWRRLRKKRVIKMVRNLWSRVDGYRKVMIEWMSSVRVYELGDGAIYWTGLQKVINEGARGNVSLVDLRIPSVREAG